MMVSRVAGVNKNNKKIQFNFKVSEPIVVYLFL